LVGIRRISAHCAAAAGSRPAAKLKKLRSAASRQLRVPMQSRRFCSVYWRKALTSAAVNSPKRS
jgi:hypothetical protein